MLIVFVDTDLLAPHRGTVAETMRNVAAEYKTSFPKNTLGLRFVIADDFTFSKQVD